ncbi:hypothetical protein C8J95_102406 [Elizabethkingia sp. YR214]|nr:hypothetical protein C8J95_102406 [Elizabethkingia sp. YR214]
MLFLFFSGDIVTTILYWATQKLNSTTNFVIVKQSIIKYERAFINSNQY